MRFLKSNKPYNFKGALKELNTNCEILGLSDVLARLTPNKMPNKLETTASFVFA